MDHIISIILLFNLQNKILKCQKLLNKKLFLKRGYLEKIRLDILRWKRKCFVPEAFLGGVMAALRFRKMPPPMGGWGEIHPQIN